MCHFERSHFKWVLVEVVTQLRDFSFDYFYFCSKHFVLGFGCSLQPSQRLRLGYALRPRRNLMTLRFRFSRSFLIVLKNFAHWAHAHEGQNITDDKKLKYQIDGKGFTNKVFSCTNKGSCLCGNKHGQRALGFKNLIIYQNCKSLK